MNVDIERRRGFIWNGKTPLAQRFFGIDFGRFAVGLLLDASAPAEKETR